MLFAVSVSWSIVRHCPSPSSQGANTLRGDNLLALLCSLSAGSLVEERWDQVYLTKGHFEAPCLPGKVRFHPSWTILDDATRLSERNKGRNLSPHDRNSPFSRRLDPVRRSVLKVEQLGPFFFCARLTLWRGRSCRSTG